MWKQVRRSLLLGAALLTAAARAQNAGSSSGATDVLVTMPINIDGSLRDLKLLRGESIEDAAHSFARTNGLLAQDDNRVREVIDQLSGLLKDKVAEIDQSNAAKVPPPTVQLSFPLTVDGYTGEVRKHEGETVDAAAERFLYDTGFSMDVMHELFPQIVTVLNQKLAELSQRPLFTFELTIDGTPAVVRHFDGGSPTEEAIATLRSINFEDGERMDRIVPQVANEIIRQRNVRAQQATAATTTAAPPATAAPAPAPVAPRELFSIPLNINDRAAVLVHFDGRSTRESALQFLNDNGVTDPATVGSFLPQVVTIIDDRMAKFLRDEATAQAQTAQAAQAAQAPAQASVQPPTRQRLVSFSVNLGDNRVADLEYFAGDSVERTVELFLHDAGLADTPSFAASVTQLTDVVRARLAELPPPQEDGALAKQQVDADAQELERQRDLEAQATSTAASTRPTPLLTLPVTLSGKVYRLEYFAGQEPNYVATTFCVEKHELVRAEIGMTFDDRQLLECKNVLVKTINDMLAQQQPVGDAAQSPASTTTTPAAADATQARGELLFTLDIDNGDGGSYQLPFHRNDNVDASARAFCVRHNLDLSNVPALVQGIQTQLAQH